jgi:ribonuclease P protein component
MWRKLRLRRRGDFLRLRRAGRTVHHPLLLINVGENGEPHNRYGFVTPKRLGSAVVRNRVRRLLREAVRAQHPHLCQGYDVVFVAKAKLVQQPYSEVLRHVTWLFEQTGLLKRDTTSHEMASPESDPLL